MLNSQTQLRVAIAQPKMHWSGEENTSTILKCLAQAASFGAELCVLPELAVTGFHRQIASVAEPNLVGGWIRSIQDSCSRNRIAASFGTPTFRDDGKIMNSQVFVDELGRITGVVEKNWLTPAEATFFAYGTARTAFPVCGLASTAVICREIEDVEDVVLQLEGRALSVVFWPGLMGPEEGTEHIDPPSHVQHAQTLASRLSAYVVQSNWPNSLNYPEKSANAGRSAVVSPAGKLLFRLPQAEPGFGIFSLGEESYAWHSRKDA